MKIIECLEMRLEEIRVEVMRLVENQKLSLTEKNIAMEPFVDEKKILEFTLGQLHAIKSKAYKGLCGAK